MSYSVLGGTLNPTHSVRPCIIGVRYSVMSVKWFGFFPVSVSIAFFVRYARIHVYCYCYVKLCYVGLVLLLQLFDVCCLHVV